MKRLEIEGKEGGGRIDAFLSVEMEGLTRSAAQKLLDAGCVTFRGKPVRKNRLVKAGETYLVTVPEPAPAEASPQEIPLDVVFEDEDIIVVNKPKGMVVHPAAGHADGTLVNALLHHCRGELSGIGGVMRPGIVHRIDKDTSGLVIAAKNNAAHLALARQLKDHSLCRVYEAVLCGNLKNDGGTVDAPVGRHPADRKRMAVTERSGKKAVTHYEVIARYPGYSHVRCRLETGRTHQIRVHMASLGHPVLGDSVYGRKKPFPGLEGQCLHAGKLRFVHPASGREIELCCPLPVYFQQVLTKLARLD